MMGRGSHLHAQLSLVVAQIAPDCIGCGEPAEGRPEGRGKVCKPVCGFYVPTSATDHGRFPF